MRKPIILLAMTAVSLGLWARVPSSAQAQEPKEPRKIEEDEQKPEGQATLRLEVNQIQVDVTVQNKDGNLIGGLQKEHFRVWEDKVEQEIVNFSPVEAPMTVVFVAEYSRAIPWEFLNEVWWASQIFVDQMREGDWVAMVAYDIRPEILVDFTQNKADVFNALRKLNFPAFSESNLYDTVIDTLDRLEEVKGKTAVILVSSGLDTFSRVNLDTTLKAVKRTNVVIYSVAIGGNFLARNEHRIGSLGRMDFYQAEAFLKEVSKLTGGQAYFPRFVQAFPDIFRTISALLRNQYTLSYVSSNPKRDGDYRRIKVEVTADVDQDGKPDKLKASHKQGYIAGEAGG